MASLETAYEALGTLERQAVARAAWHNLDFEPAKCRMSAEERDAYTSECDRIARDPALLAAVLDEQQKAKEAGRRR
jgi:hypothetical protein